MMKKENCKGLGITSAPDNKVKMCFSMSADFAAISFALFRAAGRRYSMGGRIKAELRNTA